MWITSAFSKYIKAREGHLAKSARLTLQQSSICTGNEHSTGDRGEVGGGGDPEQHRFLQRRSSVSARSHQSVGFSLRHAWCSAASGCGCCSVLLVVDGAFSCPSPSEGSFLLLLCEAGSHCIEQPGFRFAVILLPLPPSHWDYKWEPGLKLNLGWLQDKME